MTIAVLTNRQLAKNVDDPVRRRAFASIATVGLLGLCFGATLCAADGTISAGAASFTWHFSGGGSDNADYSVGGGPDHLHEDWWWGHLESDSDESRFPAPDTEDYSGAVATLGWTNMFGLFDGVLTSTVYEGRNGTGSYVRHVFTLTNITGGALDLTMFGYLDLDLTDTAANDEAILVSDPTMMAVFDGTTFGEFHGLGADQFQAAVTQTPESLRTIFSDGELSHLDGSGLPFGPADWEGAFQWPYLLPPGAAVTFVKSYSINMWVGEIFVDGFESGGTSGW